jgi:selenide,water dikinase
MQSLTDPVLKDLVLVGGGHSHVAVLKRFGMRRVPGLRLTLIARDVHTPYSGMLPGYIAGRYSFDQCHIDLARLAQFAGARLIHAELEGLDLENRRVICRDRPPLPYELLSINTGSRPNTLGVPGAAQWALPVKPIDRFLERWDALVDRVLDHPGPFRLVVVGGGAGGVELALATRQRLRDELAGAGRDPSEIEHTLITATPEILPTHNPGVRRRLARALRRQGVQVLTERRVTRVEASELTCHDGTEIPADAVLWVTQASAPAWPREAGLATDGAGFIRVDDTLRSVSHPEVFAAGDVAAVEGHPRPKAGVFAVREGPPLERNLRRVALGRAPRPFRPQARFLSLISTGDRHAVASRGHWSFEGDWVWRWKDRIDRRFIESFNQLPEMPQTETLRLEAGLADQAILNELASPLMRCGGCGAKLGSGVLERVLGRLTGVVRDDVVLGLGTPDDAAVLRVPAGHVLVQSVDYFRAFIDDPYVFGRIAANHALGDLFAMNANPQSALAVATLPFAREAVVEDTLFQLMSGALTTLNPCEAALVGGHSGEGAELAFGLVVNGLADPAMLTHKRGMRPGDALILTKALGTGTLLAASMRRKAKGRWVQAAIDTMLVSNRAAARCLHRHGTTACTDVTGFGLLGHLVEMTRASATGAALDPGTLPLLDGAEETLEQGIFSSLQPQNLRLRRALQNLDEAARHPLYPLLFDPQTAGGLLASVPEDRVGSCLAELHELGYPEARAIGRVEEASADQAPVRLLA